MDKIKVALKDANNTGITELEKAHANQILDHFNTHRYLIAYVTINKQDEVGLVDNEQFTRLNNISEEEVNHLKTLHDEGTTNLKVVKLLIPDGRRLVALITHSGGTRMLSAPESILNHYLPLLEEN